jgi:hypothetical protein
MYRYGKSGLENKSIKTEKFCRWPLKWREWERKTQWNRTIKKGNYKVQAAADRPIILWNFESHARLESKTSNYISVV